MSRKIKFYRSFKHRSITNNIIRTEIIAFEDFDELQIAIIKNILNKSCSDIPGCEVVRKGKGYWLHRQYMVFRAGTLYPLAGALVDIVNQFKEELTHSADLITKQMEAANEQNKNSMD